MRVQVAAALGALAAGVVLASACSGSSSNRVVFDVTFEARTDDGKPLAGVGIVGNGKALGVTTDEGVLQAWVRVKEGATLRTRATCPEGYREPVQPAPLRIVSPFDN